MSYILGFAGSNSSTSINLNLVRYTASLIEEPKTTVLNMANYPFPLFSEDLEKEKGFSNSLVEFKNEIQNAAGIIISVNEHNSNPSAFFKNLIDWLSRVDINFIRDKKVLLMSTSGGKRGAKGSLEISEKLLTRFGAEVTSAFSFPSYYDNFDPEKGITDAALAKEHQRIVSDFEAKLAV